MKNNQTGNTGIIIVALIAIVVVIGVVIFFNRPETDSTESITSNNMMEDKSDSMTDHDSSSDTMMGEAKVFNIDGFNFGYSQDEIRVKKGDRVKIVLTSTDGFHDWVLDKFNVASDRVNTGETTEVEFIASEAGTFEYYCSVGQHRANGMFGKLIVEDDSAAMMEEDKMMANDKMLAVKSAGVYTDYSKEKFNSATDQKRVYFFHAAWCPTCKATNQELLDNSGDLPAGVTIFKTDYDTETELKKKYGITYQHTFVQVDADGNELVKWNGGGIAELKSNLK